jgi:hypothetical protein
MMIASPADENPSPDFTSTRGGRRRRGSRTRHEARRSCGPAYVTLIERARTHLWKLLLHAVAAGASTEYEVNYLAQANWLGFHASARTLVWDMFFDASSYHGDTCRCSISSSCRSKRTSTGRKMSVTYKMIRARERSGMAP